MFYSVSKNRFERKIADCEERLWCSIEREREMRTEIESLRLKLATMTVAQNELIRKAAEAERVKNAFLSNMSHEIRTPLGAMMGFSELMRNPDLGDFERGRYLDIVDSTGKELLRLIDDILDLSSVYKDGVRLKPVRFQFRDMIREIFDIFTAECEQKGLRLEFVEVDKMPDWLNGDRHRISQVLTNLIGNAVKFTSQGHVRVVFTTSSDPDAPVGSVIQIHSRVIDTGVGVHPEQFTKIFGDFNQADSTTTRKYNGAGLGLSLARRLAQLLGGNVTLVESGVGTGSVFQFDFECQVESAIEVSHVDKSSELDLSIFSNKSILFADDVVENRLLIEKMLSRLGFSVSVACDGAEALAIAKTRRFDIILMDMQMPVMDGYTATKLLRKQQPSIPIVALTANALSEDRNRCLESGCSDFLTKPVRREKLVTTLKNQLDGQRVG